jgi:Transcriptional regulators
LLDETLVSRQFGVSRSPVREALIRLSAEGLVQNLRNRTSIVAPFDVRRCRPISTPRCCSIA